jgi:hypothetical protein
MLKKAQEVLLDESLRASISKNAKKSVLQNFSSNYIFSKWETLINEVK